jgi:hypothetical protein
MSFHGDWVGVYTRNEDGTKWHHEFPADKIHMIRISELNEKDDK